MRSTMSTGLATLLLSAAVASAQTTPPDSTTQANGGMSSTTTTSTTTMTSSMAGDPAVEANIQKLEQELTDAYKAKNGAPFEQYLDDSIIVLFPGHKEQGKATVIQGITSNPCTINSATTSDFTFKWISSDAVLVTYTDKGDEVCQGKPSPVMDYSTSVWVKKNGKWVNTFHQSTPMESGKTLVTS